MEAPRTARKTLILAPLHIWASEMMPCVQSWHAIVRSSCKWAWLAYLSNLSQPIRLAITYHMTEFSKTGGQPLHSSSWFFLSRSVSLRSSSNAAMSSVIDTNLPSVGRDQGTKRKHAALPEGGKENQVGPSTRPKPNKKVKVTEATEQVSTTGSLLWEG